jgi:hypothetical protein
MDTKKARRTKTRRIILWEAVIQALFNVAQTSREIVGTDTGAISQLKATVLTRIIEKNNKLKNNSIHYTEYK